MWPANWTQALPETVSVIVDLTDSAAVAEPSLGFSARA
jgi:hypothetical protein